jgi:hypothetical protein
MRCQSKHFHSLKSPRQRFALEQCSATFFHPRHTLICQRHMTAHHKMSPHEKRYEIYMVMNMFLHINTCPIRMQAYENKIFRMLNKTIDDER